MTRPGGTNRNRNGPSPATWPWLAPPPPFRLIAPSSSVVATTPPSHPLRVAPIPSWPGHLGCLAPFPRSRTRRVAGRTRRPPSLPPAATSVDLRPKSGEFARRDPVSFPRRCLLLLFARHRCLSSALTEILLFRRSVRASVCVYLYADGA